MNNIAGHISPALYTKHQANQPSGSGEEDFLKVLQYMGMVATFIM